MIVKTGDKAKDFELNDQDGKEIRLSDFKGKKVLLSFIRLPGPRSAQTR